MINDLNASLLKLARTHPNIKDIPVLFDVPSREWSSNDKVAVNFHLYDIRENLDRRDTQRQQSELDKDGKVKLSPRPVRLSLSYLVTCWGKAEDQYKLLWSVLETLSANSPIEEDFLEGDLKKQGRVPTQVAQPDGVLQNISEFWSTLGNQIRPSVSLVATLELSPSPRPQVPDVYPVQKSEINLRPGTVALRVRVMDKEKTPVSDAEVSLKGKGPNDRPVELAALPDSSDGYVFRFVPGGTYTLEVKVGDGKCVDPKCHDRGRWLRSGKSGSHYPELRWLWPQVSISDCGRISSHVCRLRRQVSGPGNLHRRVRFHSVSRGVGSLGHPRNHRFRHGG